MPSLSGFQEYFNQDGLDSGSNQAIEIMGSDWTVRRVEQEAGGSGERTQHLNLWSGKKKKAKLFEGICRRCLLARLCWDLMDVCPTSDVISVPLSFT